MPDLWRGMILLVLNASGKVLLLMLRLKICASGVLISIAVNFKSFIEMPSMSVLSFDLEFCIILHISPGLMVPKWRSGELLGERKDSGEMGESGRESAMFLPVPAKNLLKALAMEDGSVKVQLFSLISLIFLVALFILIASFRSCQVFLGFFFDRDRLVSKYIFLLARSVEL